MKLRRAELDPVPGKTKVCDFFSCAAANKTTIVNIGCGKSVTFLSDSPAQ